MNSKRKVKSCKTFAYLLISSTQFLAPQYNLVGGGGSEVRYNSTSVGDIVNGISNFALGVAEK